ncbi:unnamed protein product [Absidia cylindrospora]
MNERINKESFFDFSDDEDEQVTIPKKESLTFWGASSDSETDDETTSRVQFTIESISQPEQSSCMSDSMLTEKSSSTEKVSSKLLSAINNIKRKDRPTQFSSKDNDMPTDPPFERPPKNTSVTNLSVELGPSDKDDKKNTILPIQERIKMAAGRKSLSFGKKKSKIYLDSDNADILPPPQNFSPEAKKFSSRRHANPALTKPLPPPPKLNPSDKISATNPLKIITAKPSSLAAKKSPRIIYHDIFGSTDEDSTSEEDSPLTVLEKYRQKAQTPETPFHIVLVDIKIAAEERHIHCEKKPLDDTTPAYVALSYRWGELDEQMVPATKDYHARISSFQLGDFFKLCRAMRHEPDLQAIRYVWVDAICVNQDHLEKRKETIYRMNDIYIHATTIVAVPDLHALHLAISSTANRATMAIIKKYRCYLYYLLVGTSDAQQTLVKMDHAWMDTLGVPAMDVHRRDIVTSSADAKKSPFLQEMMTLMFQPMSLARSMPPHAQAEQHQQHLPYRMMVEFQRLEWQQHLAQRKTDVIKCMEFLQSIMEDWSNRTWVISEYHIAKRKTGTLKFWYNQLSCADLDGLPFFEFDFTQPKKVEAIQHPLTSQIIYLTRKFNGSMHRRLTKRSVLEMMLQTKASKHEDRFHSIIPLAPKYKHHITDRHSISRLGISDMLSVRLQLMAWMDTKDRLNLLFCTRHHPLPSRLPLLPTFASHVKTIQPGIMACLTTSSGVACNFDLHDHKSVRLVRHRLATLWLHPRMVAIRTGRRHRSFYHEMGGKSHPLWSSLGLDPNRDALDAVSIPLFCVDTTSLPRHLMKSDLQIVGSWEKNIWLVYPFCSNYKDGRIYPSRMCSMNKSSTCLPNGFRIF